MQWMDVQIPAGVVRLGTPSLSPDRWYAANLVRWREGKMQPIGGWSRISETPLPSDVRKIATWRDNANVERVAFGCEENLILLEGNAYTDITPEGFVGSGGELYQVGYSVGPYGAEAYGTARSHGSTAFQRPLTWSLQAWGEQLLGVWNVDGRLLRWAPNSPMTKAEAVPNAPANNRAMVVTPERHVLLVGAGNEPRRIAWCSSEDYTDWNFSSITNTAGFLDLQTRGTLTYACPVRDGTLVFSESDVWLVSYIGQPFVYSAQQINGDTSLLGPNTVAVFGGRAAWMGKTGFWVYDGGVVRPLPSDVSAYVYDDIDERIAPIFAHASANGVFPEIWWFYPSRGSDIPNRYVIWNYAENWWAIGEMARTAMAAADVRVKPLAVGADKHVYQHEDGWTAAGRSRVGTVFAESGTLGGQQEGVAILRAQFDSGSSGHDATSLSILSRQTRDGPETHYGPFNARADGHCPMRAGGRDIRLRVSANRDQEWIVGAMRFDVSPGGVR